MQNSEQPTPPQQNLFRQQALASQKHNEHGRVVLIRPPSFRVWTALAVVAGLLVVALFYFGTYTKRTPVMGQLMPVQGLVRVYPMQNGVVTRRYVQEGQVVKQGDVLYGISSERTAGDGGNIQAQISQRVRDRQGLLASEIQKTQQAHQDERRLQQTKVDGLQQDLLQLQSLIVEQRQRVALSNQAVTRYQQLGQQGFVSQEQLQQQQADLFDQRSRLQTLERDVAQTQSALVQARTELANLPNRQQAALGSLKRGVTELSQELTESEARRELLIRAPEDGTVAAVLIDAGQVADPNRPLLSIVPINSQLQAQLYVPSRAAGFIQVGQAVRMRYQAYPYQKFGLGRGEVTTVSRTALMPNELIANGVSLSPEVLAAAEPVYRVEVRLQQQYVVAYGKQQSLQAGMLLDADILQDTRRLYEWVLEPLYTVSGHF